MKSFIEEKTIFGRWKDYLWAWKNWSPSNVVYREGIYM